MKIRLSLLLSRWHAVQIYIYGNAQMLPATTTGETTVLGVNDSVNKNAVLLPNRSRRDSGTACAFTTARSNLHAAS